MELLKQIDEYLSSKERPIKERDYFYISEIGKPKKAIYEGMKGLRTDKTEARVMRIFENGNCMHDRYYKLFAEMGILRAVEIMAVENDLFHGRADCIISGRDGVPWLVDLKSCSQWTFNKLTDASDQHKLQIQFYMYYMKIPNGMVLYENKDNQAIKTFIIQPETKKIERLIEEYRKFKEDLNKGYIPDEEVIKVEELQYGI